MTVKHAADKRCGKRRYPDELSARAMAMNSIEISEIKQLWLYHCQECKGWHLTRQNQGKRLLVEEGKPVYEQNY